MTQDRRPGLNRADTVVAENGRGPRGIPERDAGLSRKVLRDHQVAVITRDPVAQASEPYLKQNFPILIYRCRNGSRGVI